MEKIAPTTDLTSGLETVPEGSAEPQAPERRALPDQEGVADAGVPRS